MKTRWWCKWKWGGGKRAAVVILLVALSGEAFAGAPEWLRSLKGLSLPSYDPETSAVILLDEEIITVKDSGEITKTRRRAYRILRPEGREHGVVSVWFDSQTRLTRLQGWAIPASGQEYEVKEKDALETGIGGIELYGDTRHKVLRIPASDPGNVIGYEYEQKGRPTVLQDTWTFQNMLPVRQARFVLQLPTGWEFKTTWLNHAPLEPQPGAAQWTWQLENVPAIEPEDAMPDWRALTGRMGIAYYPRQGSGVQMPHGSWSEVGAWYGGLTRDRRVPTPNIQQKVRELTASAPHSIDKLRSLADFVQRDVRYVAIEIGIGGYQPHAADEVYRNRYGDCKDKATLLSTMLRAAGIQSYYVVVHTNRGVVSPAFPTLTAFNHVIVAIRLPSDVGGSAFHAVSEHKTLGQLLFFDPTSTMMPLGYLPSSLQASKGLLVTEDGGELIDLPLLPASTNRLERVAKLTLAPSGALSGEVVETRTGAWAETRRAEMLAVPLNERAKVLESFLGRFLGHSRLEKAAVANLEKTDDKLVLLYSFAAQDYAKLAGNLLLVRPRVLGQKSEDLFEAKKKKERQFPVEFPEAGIQTDRFEITLPAGYQVDELPPPVDIDCGVARYQSRIEVHGNVLRYQRDYRLNQVFVPTEKLPEMKKFFRYIAADERNTAVLRRAAQ